MLEASIDGPPKKVYLNLQNADEVSYFSNVCRLSRYTLFCICRQISFRCKILHSEQFLSFPSAVSIVARGLSAGCEAHEPFRSSPKTSISWCLYLGTAAGGGINRLCSCHCCCCISILCSSIGIVNPPPQKPQARRMRSLALAASNSYC